MWSELHALDHRLPSSGSNQSCSYNTSVRTTKSNLYFHYLFFNDIIWKSPRQFAKLFILFHRKKDRHTSRVGFSKWQNAWKWYGKFFITKVLLYICCLCMHSLCQIIWRYAEYGSVYSVCTVSSSYLSTPMHPEAMLREY